MTRALVQSEPVGDSGEAGGAATVTARFTARLRSTGSQISAWATYRRLERLLTVLVTSAFLLMFLAGQYYSPINSDTVAQQNMLRSVLEGRGLDAIVPSDSWWLHIPAYLLGSLLPNGRTAQLVEILAVHSVLLLGAVVFVRTYVRMVFPASRLALVAAYGSVGWYLGLAVSIPGTQARLSAFDNAYAVTTYLTANHRNLEAGVAFLLLAWLGRWHAAGSGWSRNRLVVSWCGGALGVAALLSSDPYFIYVLGGAVALSAGWMWLAGRLATRRVVGLGSLVAVGVAGAYILETVIDRLGIHTINATERAFVPLEGFGNNLTNAVGAVGMMFRASPWGLEIGPGIAAVVLNSVLLLATLVGLVLAARRRARASDGLRLPPIALIVVALAAYLFSTLAAEPRAFRYVFVPLLVAVPFATEAFVALARRGERWLGAVIVVLMTGLLSNVLLNANALQARVGDPLESTYGVNLAVVDHVAGAGETKGYASYWNANINTYFADREVLFLPLTFQNGVPERFGFLINTPDFDVPADRSFFYIAADEGVMLDMAIDAFGEPESVEEVAGGGLVLHFDRDIGAGLSLWSPVH